MKNVTEIKNKLDQLENELKDHLDHDTGGIPDQSFLQKEYLLE